MARCGSIAVWVASAERLAVANAGGLNADILIAKLNRLGGTHYRLAGLEAHIEGRLALPVSALHRLRRLVVERLDEALARPPQRAENPLALRNRRGAPIAAPQTRNRTELAIFCRSEPRVCAACQARPARSYADYEDSQGFRGSVAVARAAGIPIYLATPRIEMPGEDGFLRKLAGYQPDGVLVRNLEALLYFKENHSHLALVADFSLNCSNDLTARLLIAWGVETLTPSYDLDAGQMLGLLRQIRAGWFEIVPHQYMPMFHMEHCVFAANLSRGKNRRERGRPGEQHEIGLRDLAGVLFPVKADVGCRNTVFNRHAQSAALFLERFLSAGMRNVRSSYCSKIKPAAARLSAFTSGCLLSVRRRAWFGSASKPRIAGV